MDWLFVFLKIFVAEQYQQRQLEYLALFEKEMMANYLRRVKSESMDSVQVKFTKLQKRFVAIIVALYKCVNKCKHAIMCAYGRGALFVHVCFYYLYTSVTVDMLSIWKETQGTCMLVTFALDCLFFLGWICWPNRSKTDIYRMTSKELFTSVTVSKQILCMKSHGLKVSCQKN